MKPSSTVGTSHATVRVPVTERYTERQKVLLTDPKRKDNAAQTLPKVPSIFGKILSVDAKNYFIRMPLDAYRTMNEAIGTPDESIPRDTVLNVAILLFMNYVDAATTVSESCGGGGSPASGLGRDKNEKDDDWARRCAKKASWLCKPVVKLKR